MADFRENDKKKKKRLTFLEEFFLFVLQKPFLLAYPYFSWLGNCGLMLSNTRVTYLFKNSNPDRQALGPMPFQYITEERTSQGEEYMPGTCKMHKSKYITRGRETIQWVTCKNSSTSKLLHWTQLLAIHNAPRKSCFTESPNPLIFNLQSLHNIALSQKSKITLDIFP